MCIECYFKIEYGTTKSPKCRDFRIIFNGILYYPNFVIRIRLDKKKIKN